MESLLPSEIARLVLGYLEEQTCEDAARSFLETSPHLQECRIVTSTGRRFSTKVNGLTLVEILEKFCAANAIIHERLSKVSDCEQLKHCGDLLEQLRFLVDGSRGQRFVVNINVPTTSQVSGGSPIISSSMRKRHHSGSDRERSKRVQKSNSRSSDPINEPVSSQLSSNTVDTTPLENLPGHSSSERIHIPGDESAEKGREIPTTSNCSSTVAEAVGARSTIENTQLSMENVESNVKRRQSVEKSTEKVTRGQERCSTATDTKELMQYTNTEVQTNPYDVAESETESAYEPVENLSLLTKELLNRTELQERIAENINKAILPSDTSMRDVSLNESVGDVNTSIMTELNNAIKSVVTATESDPLFAQFLDEIIGPDGDNEESPDENNDRRPPRPSQDPDKPTESRDPRPEAPSLLDKVAIAKTQVAEVPLKNRLRSSSSQQSVRAEDERTIAEKHAPKDDVAVLEDVNAAAVLSIINANNKIEEDKSSSLPTNDTAPLAEKTSILLENGSRVGEFGAATVAKTAVLEKTAVPLATTSNEAKTTRKTNVRKPRVFKPRIKATDHAPQNLMSEEDIMAMPTLIVCSKEEMSTIINTAPMIAESSGPPGYCASQFLPIAPKTKEMMSLPPPIEPIYLRTVTVPTRISDIPKICGEQAMSALRTIKNGQETNAQGTMRPRSIETVSKIARDAALSTVTREVEDPEKITLYGNENSAVLENTIVSALSVVEPITGTGLSPFLKFNNRPKEVESALTSGQNPENDSQPPGTSNDGNYDHITRRTPRTLLKSRSKNNRLSMSTPRRRSSHIRALDFGTPSKSVKSARRLSTNESFDYSTKCASIEKKVCRASLFKSPPFSAAHTPRKVKSPGKDRSLCEVPIATRSPAPKLMGGWEKYTGVGMILGSSSPSSSSGSPVKISSANCTATSQSSVKSWDADLRKSLLPIEEATSASKPGKKTVAKKSAQVVKRQSRKKIETAPARIEEATSEAFKEESQLESCLEPSVPTHTATKRPSESEQTLGSVESDGPKLDAALAKASEVITIVEDTTRNLETPVDPPKIENTTGKETCAKVTKKKYATLKTLTTSVTKIPAEIPANNCTLVDSVGDYTTAEKNRPIQLPDMLELETPRKFEGDFGIPPTPRLLSPGSSNLTTPFGQIGCDATKVRGFVSTPEFPPTPSINLTPKQSSQDGNEKKEEFQACSEYYEPSSVPKDPRTKRTNEHSRQDMSLPLPGMMMAIAAESRVKNISVEVASGFQATSSSNRLEITQFEVIKENLPREEAFRELKISVCSNESTKGEEVTSPREYAHVSPLSSGDPNVSYAKDPNNTSSTLDDSSDSDSSSSSDSSTSSSSSSSSSSATSPNLTLDKSSPKDTGSKIYTDTSNDSVQKVAPASCPDNPASKIAPIETSAIASHEASREKNESSPAKVFPIAKNDELAACVTETPAKDECLLPEAVISETPSSSKAGIETTNLNSKISAFITSEDHEKEYESSAATKKVLPKVLSVQRILPNVSIAAKTMPVSDTNLHNAVQGRNQSKPLSDAKLSKQLEEKRLRLMAKFKEKEKAPVHRPRIKRAVAVARNKKPTDEMTDETSNKERISGMEHASMDVERLVTGRESIEKETAKDRSIEDTKIHRDAIPEQVAPNLDDECRKIIQNPEKEETVARVEKNEEETMKKTADEENRASEKSQVKVNELTNDEVPEIMGKDRSSGSEIQREKNNPVALRRGDSARNDKEESDQADLKNSKSRRSRSIEKARIKTDSEIGKLTKSQENKSLESSDRDNIADLRLVQDTLPQVVENARKERKDSREAIDGTKIPTKSKVDLVKRDLFSDEESNDQRTTRSRTRQASDLQESESAEALVSSLSTIPDKNNSPSCACSAIVEDMPGVLECLDLVPNVVKSDSTDETGSAILDNSQCRPHHAEYHFIYDETVSTKKRKRKFSNSELEFPVEVELSDENYRKCPKLMTATCFEEIFNLTPQRKKRGGTRDAAQCRSKRETTAIKKLKIIQEKPLATSSPMCKAASSKIAGKVSRTTKRAEPQDAKKKIVSRNEAKKEEQREHEKRSLNTRKRKASVSKDSEQTDKKSRLRNPQLLLNKLDLDKFLTTVHGPA